MAETEGFEPSIQVLPRCSLSRGVPSTTRPRLLASITLALDAGSTWNCTSPSGNGGLVEFEGLVQRAYSELHVLILDHHRDLDFRGGNHLNVDAFL